MVPPKWNITSAWPQYALVVLSAVTVPFLQGGAIPFGFILYIQLSLIYKQAAVAENDL